MWLWWDPFAQSRKCMSLKFTGDFFVMAMKNDAKFEGELTCQFIWGIWEILTQALENLKNLRFNRLLLTKVYNGWAKKKYRRVMFDGTEDWFKIWRKTDLCFQNIFVYRLKNSNFILESKLKWQNSIESRTYWFIWKITRMIPILTSKNRLTNTFIIVSYVKKKIETWLAYAASR